MARVETVKRSRKQVSRACDFCRARRIGCDNGEPCKACFQRGTECTHYGDDRPRTLPGALREIERLRLRVKELELQLEQAQPAAAQASPPIKPDGSAPSAAPSGLPGYPGLVSGHPGLAGLPDRHLPTSPAGTYPYDKALSVTDGGLLLPASPPLSTSTSAPSTLSPSRQWEGVFIDAGGSSTHLYYGPTSWLYHISRIGRYLSQAIAQPMHAPPVRFPGGAPDGALMAPQQTRPVYQQPPQQPQRQQQQQRGRRGTVISATYLSTSANNFRPLNRMQEEHLLRLFWEGPYCLMPAVDEAPFRQHYASLWVAEADGTGEEGEAAALLVRRACPVVDMIMAVCLQYGSTFMPHMTRRDDDEDGNKIGGSSGSFSAEDLDAAVAGRAYFWRAQTAIALQLNSPSLATVQCYLFMGVYLCRAAVPNMVHAIVAQAVRVATILGLHLEPPSELPAPERRLRRRLWWLLWMMDARMSTKLGRPLMMDAAAAVSTAEPDDVIEAGSCLVLGSAASFAGPSSSSSSPSSAAAVPPPTFLTYTVQLLRAYRITADICHDLAGICTETIRRRHLACLYHDADAVETCARRLASRLPALRSWTDTVPADLQLRRRAAHPGQPEGAAPFSTSAAPLDLDALMAPAWLQRQAVCLELNYHTVVQHLTRPFIVLPDRGASSCAAGANPPPPATFGPPGSTPSPYYAASSSSPLSSSAYSAPYAPTADRMAALSADHAAAYARIIHQTVMESDLLSGWSEYVGLLWNSSITLIAFLLAYPVHTATARARAAVDLALAVFDLFAARGFAMSGDAATITRDLIARTDRLAAGGGGSAAAAEHQSVTVAGAGAGAVDTAAAGAAGVVKADPMLGASLFSSTPGSGVPMPAFDSNGGDLSWLDANQLGNSGEFAQFMDWAMSVDNYSNFEDLFSCAT